LDYTVEILDPTSVHIAEDSAVLATEMASVQEPRGPVLGTGEVRPTDGKEPFVETVDAPTPNVEDQAPEEQATNQLTDTERKNEEPGRNLVPVVLSSSPESTAAMAAVAREEPAERSVGEQAHEIMLTLESAMEKLTAWAERVEAQQSETAERDVAIWKRRFTNCEESLKRKTPALSEVEEGQTELGKVLEAKDMELSRVRAELTAEWQNRMAESYRSRQTS
jgi:hypothetical protein